MKKVSFLLLLTLCFGLSACDKTENSYGELSIRSYNTSTYTYADQTVDTLLVTSSKSWTAETTDSWMTISGEHKSHTVKDGYIEATVVPVYYQTNTGTAIRYAQLKVDNTDRTAYYTAVQTYWLNINIPGPTFSDPENYTGVHFQQEVSASATSTTLQFTIYAASATLTTETGWITLGETSFKTGLHTISVAFPANNTGASRTASLVLKTSNGISNTITIKQAAQS